MLCFERDFGKFLSLFFMKKKGDQPQGNKYTLHSPSDEEDDKEESSELDINDQMIVASSESDSNPQPLVDPPRMVELQHRFEMIHDPFDEVNVRLIRTQRWIRAIFLIIVISLVLYIAEYLQRDL